MTSDVWRIVVVDDSPEDRADTRRMLMVGSDRRYAFTEAATGATGMRAILDEGAERPRCVILDLALPDMTGMEFLAALDVGDGAPSLPVVVLTGGDSAATGRKALRAGAHDYIGKGWMTPQALTRAVDIAIERWEMQGELRRNRRELQTITDNSPDILARFDRELRCAFVNAAIERTTGRPRSQFLGRSIRELGMDAALSTRWQAALLKVFDTGRPMSLEFSGEGWESQGSESQRHYVAQLVPEFDDDGRVESVLGVTHDVTDVRVSEIRARESAERLQLALSAANAGVWTRQLSSGQVYWSSENYALYGVDLRDGLIDHAVWESRLHPDDREGANAAVRDAMERGGEFRTEFRISHPQKGLRWLAGLGKVEFDGEGTPQRIVGINLDISERKELERALSEQDRRKDEFMATLAHELRNPLAPLRTGLEILRLAPPGAFVTVEALKMMERQLGYQVRLVDDLLEISRINHGTIELQRAAINLQQVVERAVELTRPVIDGAGHVLALHLPASAVRVHGDLIRLCQAVGNLLNNAAKYTPNGGHIAVDVGVEGEHAYVRVTDDGVGIPPDKLPLIFGMYTQVTASLGRAQGGLGIGLALVRKLVDLHGGSIVVESRGPGEGSAFTLRLPRLHEEDAARSAGAEIPAADAGLRPNPDVHGMRILVVDDNVDAADTLTMLLDLLGHTTQSARDGRETLAAVEAFVPHVVVLDIGLPGMNGYEVARALRARTDGHDWSLIALTGWGGETDRAKAMAAGFDYHLTKPVEMTQLQEVLAFCAARPGSAPLEAE